MIWPGVYRHVVSDSLEVQLHSETKFFGKSPARREFYRFGRLFLSADYLLGAMEAPLAGRTDTVVRTATGRAPAFWRAARPLARRIPVRSEAAAILLKNNTRSFFPGEEITLKVANPHEPASRDRIRHEIGFRRQLNPAGGFYIPQILAEGEVENATYLAETLIADHRSLSPDDINRSFAAGFVDLQRANRIETPGGSPGDGVPAAELRVRTRQGAEELGIKFPARLDQWAARFETAPRGEGPWARVHCDLSRSNILVKDGRFALIDWEFGMTAPAFVDSIRLSTQYDAFADLYIDAWAESEARQWFVLACLRTCSIHVDRMRGLASNRHSIAARRKAYEKVRKIISLAERHCPG